MNTKTKQEIIEVAGRIANARAKLSADEQELEDLLAKIAAKPVIDNLDVEPVKLTKAILKLREEKPRTPPPHPSKQARNTGVRAKVLDCVNDSGGRTWTAFEVFEATGVPSATAATMLSELAKDGFVRRVARGKYAECTNSEPKQGREDGDEVNS